MVITSQDLRKKFLEFFKSKGHKVIPSASLIPANDPTVLFTTAGMHPLVPYLLGEPHPSGKRLASCQKCIRTGDIDEVGDDVHLTFFEMLGNWSLGDYFKKEAIEWSFEFLTSKEWLGLPIEKLAVSCFTGDNDAPRDEESAEIWQSLGIPKDRIFFFGKKDNWWGPAGETGPCGPDTEMFYWTGQGEPEPLVTGDNKEKWVEIWNDVFMQYNKTADGKYEPLKQKNVDTGMGLERTLVALNGFSNVYETDLFKTLINKIEELAGKVYGQDDGVDRSIRIIADHMRAAVFILGDEKGIEPSNIGRGYVLRRLIRRVIRYGKMLGISRMFTASLAEVIVSEMSQDYPELEKNNQFIFGELEKEEEKFKRLLEDGLKKASKILEIKEPLAVEDYTKVMQLAVKKSILGKIFKDRKLGQLQEIYEGLPVSSERIFKATIFGKESFDLYQSYGFPIEMIIELAQEKYLFVDVHDFEKELKKHQELSRTASAGQFKGGLADHSEIMVRYHTATHLLNAALRKVLGEHVFQKGSNITAERTRFDFSHPAKLTDKQKKQVEQLVNEWIEQDLPVKKKVMSLEEARKLNAIGVFGEKYADTVSVYTVVDPKTNEVISREFCGGPHMEHLGQIGKFKIIKEEAVAAGIRRIKAVVE